MAGDDATGRAPGRGLAGLVDLRGRVGLAGIVGVLVLAAVLRIGVLTLAAPTKIIGDEYYYANVAVNIAHGDGHTTSEITPLPFAFGKVEAFRPPAHPFLLSSVLSDERVTRTLRAADPAAVVRPMLWLQVGVSTLLVAATFWLGMTLFGPRVGLIAAGLAAVDPVQIAYSHYLWSEPLFSLLVCTALALAALYRKHPTPMLAVGAGLALGVGGLTREIAIPITGLVALWWTWLAAPERRRRAIQHAGLMIAVAALIVCTWTARNFERLDRFVPVATIGPYALAEGNVKLEGEAALLRFKLAYQEEPGELAKMDLARARAWESITGQLPGWLVAKPVDVLRALLAPNNYIYQKLWLRAYGRVSLGTVRALVLGSALFTTLVIVAAVLGFATMDGRGPRALLLAVIGSALAVHVLANAASRFRVPWLPLLYVAAALAIVRFRALASLEPRARAMAAGALLVFIALGLVPFAGDLPAMWAFQMPGSGR